MLTDDHSDNDSSAVAALLTNALQSATSAPPFTMTLGNAWSVGDRRRRRRHRATVAGVTAVAVVVLAGVPTAMIRSGHTSSAPAKLAVASTPPAVAIHDVAGENSPFWFEQYDEIYYSTGADGKTVKHDQLDDLWLGHDRSSIGGMGSGPDYPKPYRYPAFGKGGFAASTSHAWDDQWNSATDPATVKTYLATVGPTDAKTGDYEPQTDMAIFEAGYRALEFPGTTDFRTGIIAVMRALPEVTVSTGTDDAGRAATLLSFDEGHGSTTTSYVDLPSATLLETDQHYAPAPPAASPTAGAAVKALPATALTRYVNLWRQSGPAETAPSGATTAEQKVTALSIPANPDPGHPMCTPGKPVDSTPLAAQMAAICLPDPAPGFPARRGLDYFGEKTDRSFYLSQAKETTTTLPGGGTETSGGKATVTIQIQPNNSFSLTGAKSITPDSHGMVGSDKYVGSTTVLGVPASETVPVAPTDNGGAPVSPDAYKGVGLSFSIDGLGVEMFADSDSTFQQLITLADSLHIGPQPAG